MPNPGTQPPGVAGTCGNTLAMVNAICDPEACIRNQSPTSEKLNATSFVATTSRCKHFGGRTRGILLDKNSPRVELATREVGGQKGDKKQTSNIEWKRVEKEQGGGFLTSICYLLSCTSWKFWAGRSSDSAIINCAGFRISSRRGRRG